MLPPSLGLAFEVDDVVLPLLPPFLLLPLLEQAAATRAKAITADAMVKWWRARSLVATFPPAVECRRTPGTSVLPGVTRVTF